MLTAELIEHILARLPGATVGLIGDLFLDRYLDIDPSLGEPSVETGLTAYQVTRVRNYPGALGTVMNNLVALGVGRIVPITFIGDDGEGFDLKRSLMSLAGIETEFILPSPDMRTPTYTKPMHGTTEGNRLDFKNRSTTPPGLQRKLISNLERCWPALDVLLVLDQVSERDCGVVTQGVREKIEQLARRDSSIFMLADSRERIGEFRGLAIKPNRAECLAAGGIDVLTEYSGRTVFCTEGEAGLRVYRNGKEELIPGFLVEGPLDICGAGDSCSAAILCAKVAGCTDAEAAAFGNLVASITVRQIGTTGTATPEQVRDRWREINC